MRENSGISKYVILGMLAKAPQTGYTIKKRLEKQYSHFWQESFGQIYPTLRRLVAEGLAVSSDNTQSGNGRGQIVYSITIAGCMALSDWLRKEPEIEKLRYEILLKISLGDNTEPEVLLGHLDHFIERNVKKLNAMNEYIEHFNKIKEQNIDCTYNQLTALCGVYFYSAMNEWAVEAKKIISEKNGE